MQIVVVRHAQAEPKKTWTGPDDERPLLPRGKRQARRLGKVIGGHRPARVVSSPAARCRLTVEPYALESGVNIELSPALARDAASASIELIKQLVADDSSPVVLCTHREVLNELLPQLAKDAHYKLRHRLPGAKGGAWVLHFHSGQLEKVDYRPPAA